MDTNKVKIISDLIEKNQRIFKIKEIPFIYNEIQEYIIIADVLKNLK